jgi:hypothetical protein
MAASILLAQHKGHERISEVRTSFGSASPFFPEFTYYLILRSTGTGSSTDRKREYIKYKMKANKTK